MNAAITFIFSKSCGAKLQKKTESPLRIGIKDLTSVLRVLCNRRTQSTSSRVGVSRSVSKETIRATSVSAPFAGVLDSGQFSIMSKRSGLCMPIALIATSIHLNITRVTSVTARAQTEAFKWEL